jgi:hypothetical protein
MPRNEKRPIKFSRHAMQRMVQRKIDAIEVEQAIRSGAWHPNSTEGWVSRAAFGGRIYDIVFIETTDEDGEAIIEILLVVTVVDAQKGWR